MEKASDIRKSTSRPLVRQVAPNSLNDITCLVMSNPGWRGEWENDWNIENDHETEDDDENSLVEWDSWFWKN